MQTKQESALATSGANKKAPTRANKEQSRLLAGLLGIVRSRQTA